MKIKDIRSTAPSKKSSPINEAEHRPRVGGKIYDAIKRNLAVIGAEEKQDIVSLLQTPGVTTASSTTTAATEPVDPIAARRLRRLAANAAQAQQQMANPANRVKPAVWKNNRNPSAAAAAAVQKESQEKCPHCGGPMFSETLKEEKKDACYYKVKSRYKVWPSAYASGALVQCRKKGADNWGSKS
jgi:hypothetical protein